MPQRAPNHRPAHAANGKRNYDRFYKRAAWQRFRRWFLAQPEHVVCQECRRAEATEVDHVIPLRQRPDLGLDPLNARALCASCHSKKTRRENSKAHSG